MRTQMLNTVTTTARQQFQELFRKAREEKGWTQAQAAEAAGVTQTFVSSAIERGPGDKVTFINVIKYAKTLGIDMNTLVEIVSQVEK